MSHLCQSTTQLENAVCIGLHALAFCVHLHFVFSLEKLLSLANSSVLTKTDAHVYSASIVHQCRMLESQIGTDIVAECLHDPENAIFIVQFSKRDVLRWHSTLVF